MKPNQSAFKRPVRRNLQAIIERASEADPSQVTPCNLTRKMTMALQGTYSEIMAAKKFGNATFAVLSGGALNTMFNNSNGALALPVIGKRYKLVETIGKGTFSQIFLAVDSFIGEKVAMKVVMAGYNIQGQRESAFLKHFASKTTYGSNHCKIISSIWVLSSCPSCLLSHIPTSSQQPQS